MYRRPSDVAHVLDGDRAVLLHLPSARRVVLTPTATRTWQLLLEHGGVDDVTDVLVAEYAARRKRIDRDVRALVASLLAQDLLEEVPDEPDARRAGWRRRWSRGWRRFRYRARPPFRSVRFLAALGLVVLTLVGLSAWAASVALRPASAPPPPAVAPQSGALAVVADGGPWRALNTSPCGAGAPTVPVQRLVGTEWVTAATPLVQVDQLAFASASVGVAVGLDTHCTPAYAVTSDGGQHWAAGSPARALLSASVGAAGATTVWALDGGGSGQPRLVRLIPDGSATVGAAEPVPCGQDAGPPSLLAAVDDRYGLALCQGPSGEGRLLLRTTTAGRYWDRLTDARPSTGLDLTGRLLALSFPSSSHGYVLGAASACPAGQLRESVDAGQTWVPLPCLPGLTQVLSVAFSTDRNGLVLGRSGDVVTVFRTTDGGRTWSPIG